jgi:aspartate racemase
MSELVNGVYRDEVRSRFFKIADGLRSGIEALVLGGTELPLLMRKDGETDIPLMDTARLHVEKGLEELLS